MIQQFVELGEFFLQQESEADPLERFAQDPSQKAHGTTILLIVIGPEGFREIRVEDYDAKKRLYYLYRQGPANGCEPTPTTRMATWDSKNPDSYRENTAKKLRRLKASVDGAQGRDPDFSEIQPLKTLSSALTHEAPILEQLRQAHPDPGVGATLSLAWRSKTGELKRVGDFDVFRRSLREAAEAGSSQNKTIGEVRGHGTCSICGAADVTVSGLLQVPNFKFYTLDKPGSVSGGFDPSLGWRNFPACAKCCSAADYAGERVKKTLSFNYYGFKYLVLPLPIRPIATSSFEVLGELVSARMSSAARKRLTSAEDEILFLMAEEKNALQYDLLFYEPSPTSFRPALYVSGLLPSRFRQLFAVKDRVDAHPWLNPPGPRAFADGGFTFGSFRNIFPQEYGGASFDDDFLEATRCALEQRRFHGSRMLGLGMRWVRSDFINGKGMERRLAELFRSVLFFEYLTGDAKRTVQSMRVDYGESEQARRVREVFAESSPALQNDGAAQAAFLVGACCARVEWIQKELSGSAPFVGKYKGLHLSGRDIRALFVKAKDKAQQYGDDQERKVGSLLGCAAAALAAVAGDRTLGPDEISYYFALGHTLSARLGKEQAGEDHGQ